MFTFLFKESRIGVSSSATFQETGKPLYIKNTDYPSPIRATETSMSCSIETSSCTSRVGVYFVHFELSDGGGACKGTQNLQIVDKGVTETYTCSDNMGYTINQKLTSTSNYLNLTLNNPDGITDGKFWIGFKGILISYKFKNKMVNIKHGCSVVSLPGAESIP